MSQDECRATTKRDAHQAFSTEEEDITTQLQEEAVCPHQEPAHILWRDSRGRLKPFKFIVYGELWITGVFAQSYTLFVQKDYVWANKTMKNPTKPVMGKFTLNCNILRTRQDIAASFSLE